MIAPTQDDYWTRRRRTLLARVGGGIQGAGLPRPVLEETARRLGCALVLRPHPDEDEYTAAVTLGPWRGTLHDDCFVRLTPDAPRLRAALVGATLDLHAFYLGAPPGPAMLAAVLDHLTAGVEVDVRSLPARRQLRITSYPAAAGWWARLTAPATHIPL